MVTDAFFIDYDKDADEDLWVVAEWAKGRMFQNNKGEFIDLTQQLFLDQPTGLWQSTTPFDIDLDGDIDLVVGNVGLNTKYTASSKFPLKMYRTDVDDNGQEETLLAIANKEFIILLMIKTDYKSNCKVLFASDLTITLILQASLWKPFLEKKY